MLKLLIIVSAFLCFTGTPAKIYAEYHMQYDKKLHLGAGLIIGGASYYICPKLEELVFNKSRIYPAIWSISMAALAGAGKEIIYDDYMGRGYPDKKDFYYTVIGGAISGFFLAAIETVYKSSNRNVYFEANPVNKKIAVSYHHSY
jgi:hypothetical protein